MRRQSLQYRGDWIALGTSTTNQHRLQLTEATLRAQPNLERTEGNQWILSWTCTWVRWSAKWMDAIPECGFIHWRGCEILCPALKPTVQHRYCVVKEFRRKDERIMKRVGKHSSWEKVQGVQEIEEQKVSAHSPLWHCQTQTGFRGFFSLANTPKNWKLNQEHPFRHMVYTFYRKDDLPLEHLSSSLTNVTSLDTKHFTGFFSKRYVLFQPKLIWEKRGLCYLGV